MDVLLMACRRERGAGNGGLRNLCLHPVRGKRFFGIGASRQVVAKAQDPVASAAETACTSGQRAASSAGDLAMQTRFRVLAFATQAIAVSLYLVACGGGGGYGGDGGGGGNGGASLSRGPLSSGPVQITADDKTVWVVNPDTDSVTAVDAQTNQRGPEYGVGDEPRNLAISPDGAYVFVANAGEDTLSIIDAKNGKVLADKITVGMEPYGLAFSPNGGRLYVANARSNTVSVVDPKNMTVITTIEGVGNEPRGVAVTNDGDADDADEKVYVTQFLGVDRPGVVIGADDYKEGRVTVIATADNRVQKQAVLNPMADTGFKSKGSALKKIAATEDVVTGASPNMLQAIAIKGSRAYLPNTCASPDGPVFNNVNVQSCLSVLDTTSDAEGKVGDALQTINMNRGINFEVPDPADERKKLFLAVPWAVAFKNQSMEGYAVSLSSNVVVKVRLDADGTPTINAPKNKDDLGAIVRILVGQGPRGIAINGADTRAYVANENSRDLSVIDLATDEVIATVPTADLPAPGSDAAREQIGKAAFDSSSAVKLDALSSPNLSGVIAPGRLSKEGWSSCFACHAFGKTDGIIWIFATGPRRSSPLNWSFSPVDADDIKLLNHSALNDDFQDFVNNMKVVSGGTGLIDDGGATAPPLNVNNIGRSAQLDALTFYAAKAIKTPRSPTAAEPADTPLGRQIARGRTLFQDANCASCHGGAGWASGRLNGVLRDNSGKVVNIGSDAGVAVALDVLREVGTFDQNAVNEIKDNGTTAAGALGYNPPSLLGAFALAPYLHNGSAFTLQEVMTRNDLKRHRVAGLAAGDVDPFDDAANVADMVAFLSSIDGSTTPFDITALPATSLRAKAP
jgi:YVTN family beta-propeller protein